MSDERLIPADPLVFIKECVRKRWIVWTYHVNMRLSCRKISRSMVLDSIDSFEIIESYPQDKYLPSYLVYMEHEDQCFHVLFATDVQNENVRIITAYPPDPCKWSADLKRRLKS